MLHLFIALYVTISNASSMNNHTSSMKLIATAPIHKTTVSYSVSDNTTNHDFSIPIDLDVQYINSDPSDIKNNIFMFDMNTYRDIDIDIQEVVPPKVQSIFYDHIIYRINIIGKVNSGWYFLGVRDNDMKYTFNNHHSTSHSSNVYYGVRLRKDKKASVRSIVICYKYTENKVVIESTETAVITVDRYLDNTCLSVSGDDKHKNMKCSYDISLDEIEKHTMINGAKISGKYNVHDDEYCKTYKYDVVK